MNKIYIYEDTFLNLLTLIAYLTQYHVTPTNIKTSNYSPNLFEENITLNLKNNPKIIAYLKENYSYPLKIMYYVYLSTDTNKELIIYYFYLNLQKYRHQLLNMRNLKCVSASLKISHYVQNEAHKLKGFIRFTELTNKVLYAKVNPTNNVLIILANHFKKRLPNEYWIIHDENHHLLSIYDKKNIYLINEKNLQLNLQSTSTTYEDLWCAFYDTIGIKERKNIRCQMNFMPKKYWSNIIEMRNQNEKSN